jgi:hypothetical protein
MVARATLTAPDHLPGLIGQQRFGAGLSTVNPQIEACHLR